MMGVSGYSIQIRILISLVNFVNLVTVVAQLKVRIPYNLISRALFPCFGGGAPGKSALGTRLNSILFIPDIEAMMGIRGVFCPLKKSFMELYTKFCHRVGW